MTAKQREANLFVLVKDAIDAWPQFDTDNEEVSGADMVEWFAQWRERAQFVLNTAARVG